jgi:hypothetical protein
LAVRELWALWCWTAVTVATGTTVPEESRTIPLEPRVCNRRVTKLARRMRRLGYTIEVQTPRGRHSSNRTSDVDVSESGRSLFPASRCPRGALDHPCAAARRYPLSDQPALGYQRTNTRTPSLPVVSLAVEEYPRRLNLSPAGRMSGWVSPGRPRRDRNPSGCRPAVSIWFEAGADRLGPLGVLHLGVPCLNHPGQIALGWS